MSYKLSPVVGSLGKSGSSILFQGLCRTLNMKGQHGQGNIEGKKLEKGHVYKGHFYPPSSVDNHGRIVFTYSDPVDIVCSLINHYHNRDKGKSWFALHASNLKHPGANIEEIHLKDILGLETMFDSFMSVTQYPVLMVKYPYMHDYLERIQEYLQFDFEIDAYKPRDWKCEDIVDDQKLNQIKKTYKTFIEKVESMPDEPVLLNG